MMDIVKEIQNICKKHNFDYVEWDEYELTFFYNFKEPFGRTCFIKNSKTYEMIDSIERNLIENKIGKYKIYFNI